MCTASTQAGYVKLEEQNLNYTSANNYSCRNGDKSTSINILHGDRGLNWDKML